MFIPIRHVQEIYMQLLHRLTVQLLGARLLCLIPSVELVLHLMVCNGVLLQHSKFPAPWGDSNIKSHTPGKAGGKALCGSGKRLRLKTNKTDKYECY